MAQSKPLDLRFALVSTPRISVIMPTFNSSRYISEAVDSVLAQSETDVELLIVDGGSKDRTVEIIRSYEARDSRVRYVPNPDDKGPAHARATGSTTYHPIGSCKIGIDPMAVVDPATMKVIGLEGLRVADASCMPTMVSGNTYAATNMIAEKAADLIAA